jgi:hypothetical protein
MIEEPGIDIEKVTNSVDNQNTTPPDFDNEDNANGSGVPVIPADSNITWTYKVTNTGDQAFAKADVIVQDSVAEVNGTLVLVDDADGDDILSPGEMWFYEATGIALDLLNPPDPLPDGVNIVEGCSNSFGDPQPPTATYMNTATVTADGLDDSDDSHYCGPPPFCEVIVTKTCIIPEPPTSELPGKCKGKIQEFTLIWPDTAGPITLSQVGDLTFDKSQVQPGDEVTFFNTSGDNDVFVNISGSANGQSKFHLSCSDKDMNADNENDVQEQLPGRSQDCGKNAGDAKGNESSFITDWIFEGLVDSDNKELDCTAAPEVPTEPVQCEFTPEPGGPDSADVVYGIKVENPNNEAIEVRIVDGLLGIDEMQSIPANDTFELVTDPITVMPDASNVFKNTVTVIGTSVSGATCEAMDMVTVKRNPPLIPPGSCADGKPVSLVFEYTGEDCDLNPTTDPATNLQLGKFTCTGDPNDTAPVQVVITEKENKYTVTPDSIGLNDLVTIASSDGKSLPSNTTFDIQALDGTVLQSINIHTSCSKELAEGDRFGSLILKVFVPTQ